MKKITLIFLFVMSFMSCWSQLDQTPIVVNVRDNAKLQYNGAVVKMKATVLSFEPVTFTTKDFRIVLSITMFENNGGSYGAVITDLVRADGTLSPEEKADLLERYADKIITYTTNNKYVDMNGDPLSQGAPGAIPELQYWQTFKLNQVAGMGSVSTQGALDAEYLTIRAIVLKLNQRKNF